MNFVSFASGSSGNCALVCPKKCLSIKEAASNAVRRTNKEAETETHANA